jgi:cytochrome c oxidase subunit 2
MNIFKHNIISDYQMFFHQAGSCQMEGIISLYNYIMTFLVVILFVVTTALIFIITNHLHGQRHVNVFKSKVPAMEVIEWMKFLQTWTHSTILELVWTIIPTLILIAIAIPSFILLYSLDEIVDTQCVIKIIAYQWYWKYEYPVYLDVAADVDSFSYLSYMLTLENLTFEDNLRLLDVDTPLILPTNVNVKLIITSKDVLHSFAVPALGIKMDAVPGRLNQVTVHVFKPGIYYGQCSELCGVNHAFMPIVLHAIDLPTFSFFLEEGLEITRKQYFFPFATYSEAYVSLLWYQELLTIALLLTDWAALDQIFLDGKILREEVIARTLLFNPNNEFRAHLFLTAEEKERYLDDIIVNELTIIAQLINILSVEEKLLGANPEVKELANLSNHGNLSLLNVSTLIIPRTNLQASFLFPDMFFNTTKHNFINSLDSWLRGTDEVSTDQEEETFLHYVFLKDIEGIQLMFYVLWERISEQMFIVTNHYQSNLSETLKTIDIDIKYGFLGDLQIVIFEINDSNHPAKLALKSYLDNPSEELDLGTTSTTPIISESSELLTNMNMELLLQDPTFYRDLVNWFNTEDFQLPTIGLSPEELEARIRFELLLLELKNNPNFLNSITEIPEASEQPAKPESTAEAVTVTTPQDNNT